MEIKDPQFIGSRLLERGFRVWFLYLFRYINGTPFIEQPLHRELFKQIERMLHREDNRLCINLAPRSGKCFGKGTLVRMFDGTVKKIEDISVGELVMGRDSTPRIVIGLGRGKEQMYKITNADGTSFICNESHLLVLHNTINSGRIRLGRGNRSYAGFENIISVREYLKAAPNYKKRNKMIKAAVEYPHTDTPLDPYMLGLWLGDGSTHTGNITNIDKEVIDYIYKWAEKNGNTVRVQKQKNTSANTYCLSAAHKNNSLRLLLKQIGVLDDKHIPQSYMITDSDSRKRLLAGLIDSDGFVGGGKGTIVISQKSEKLLDQIVDLARGLGFYVSKQVKHNKKYNKNYFYAYISGNIDSLPLLLKRKNSGISGRKISPLFQSFKIEPIGVDNYYGICVDEDEEFLLADYTVVHNTTLNMWMVVYILTVNPRAQIIYTSFNQDLLRQIAEQVAAIMGNPLYQAMYGRSFVQENEEVDPIDDFWKDWLFRTTGKLKFSSRKITTPNGGVVLFSSIGSAITGFGAGLRHPESGVPDGGLFIDDADKPTEVRSEKIRQKTHTYFQETLLSRLNNSNTVISNTQQRLHLDDMTGFLVAKYGFKVFKFPLIAEDGTCNLGNQYTPERIKELQVDKYTFSAQYQQEPIILGGGVIRHEWWRFYKDMNDCMYRRIFITADTAMKTKEWNDFTAIGVWGLTNKNRLRLLDLVHGKFEIPELESIFLSLWEKWRMGIGTCRCSSIIIEDKASGTQLIQSLMRKGGLPIQRVIPEHDKYTRVQNATPQLAAGNIELPENDQNPLSKLLIDEADAFTADDSHLHDDLCFAKGTKIATLFGLKNVEDVKPGDFIITPIGIRRCVKSGLTGIRNTICKAGLEATPNHKVFYNGGFYRIDGFTSDSKCSIFALKELLLWTYKKQLYSMERNIDLWGREDIIYLNRKAMLAERVPKDFILRFGSFIRDKKFRKAMSFTIKTTTALTTTFIIWNVFRVANTLKCIWQSAKKLGYMTRKSGWRIWTRFAQWLPNGISHQKALNGIKKTVKNKEHRLKFENAQFVKKSSNVNEHQNKNYVAEDALVRMQEKYNYKKPVYNIKVENAGCYYANGILVSNCDMWCYAVDSAFNSRGIF